MQADAAVFDYLKESIGLESDTELVSWLGISRDSLSGIRTGRLPMGDAIRFQILNKWWAELRPASVGLPELAAQAIKPHVGTQNTAVFCSASLLPKLQLRLKEMGKEVPGAAGSDPAKSMPVDGELLGAYKVYKGCATDAQMGTLLGIKRQSISMVRSGRNGLGPIPLLKIFEDVMGAGDLGLQAAVQSSEALLGLITQEASAGAGGES